MPENNGEQLDSEYSVLNLDRGSMIATRVRLAGTSSTRRKGLLGLPELDDDSGIWIAPCEAIHTFGMQILLDVVFLDRKLKVCKLASRLVPRRISFCVFASSVLELGAGAILRSETQLGDRLAFRRGQSDVNI